MFSQGEDTIASEKRALTIASPQLRVWLDRVTGLPTHYECLALGVGMRGSDAEGITATLFRASPRGFHEAPVLVDTVQMEEQQADLRCSVAYEQQVGTTFTLRYAVEDATLWVSLTNVQEQPGYELIEVDLPCLVSVDVTDGSGWLAHGESGGHVVDLATATAGRLPPNPFFGNIWPSLPVAMVGTECTACVQEVLSYMDTVELSVGDQPDRRVRLGTVKVHRVHSGRGYYLNTGYIDADWVLVYGNERTPNLIIEQDSVCRLDFFGDVDGNGRVDWLDGAKLVRARMPTIPNAYYHDKFMYHVACDFPKEETPRMTFAQTARMMRGIAALSDGAPQVAVLGGWQYRGHDSGYPADDVVNERLGGPQGLQQLMDEARRINGNVTFHTNYDDAYRSSPAWDERYIARRPDGELWMSRNWTGLEYSYVQGLSKYMSGPGPERVRRMCETFDLRDTILVDVLTWFSVRNDWDPEHPASGIKNLFEGRYRVLEEFARYGIDVASEAMRYAYIGKVSYFVDSARSGIPRPCPLGGEPIPLMPAIYRQSAVWGDCGGPGTDNVLSMLFNNCKFHHWLDLTHWTMDDLGEIYYLITLPWIKLHQRNIESYEREGERIVIGLGQGSWIEIDWTSKHYAVTLDGIEILRDSALTCTVDKDRIAFYALQDGTLTHPLPADWEAGDIVAHALFVDHREKVPVQVVDGHIRVSMSPRRPVIVYRNRELALSREIVL